MPETQDKIIKALQEFDTKYRDSDGWRDWEEKGGYKYVLVHDDAR